MGFDLKFADDFSRGFHAFGVVWRPNDLIFEVDGDPVAAIVTSGAIKGTADVRFSTAVSNHFGGAMPADPTGHQMLVKSLAIGSP